MQRCSRRCDEIAASQMLVEAFHMTIDQTRKIVLHF
jgi:hypothetical protein